MSDLQVGGQAVIEGVMMRSPGCFAVALRTPSGRILLRERRWVSLAQRWRFLRWPFFRGVLVLAESLHNGISALNFSAAVADPGNKDAGGAAEKPASLWITLAFAILMALALFAALPHFLTWGLGKAVSSEELTGGRSVSFHVVDGAIKLAIFIGYVYLISLLPDVRRVFQYHGAEHKAIAAFEHREPLTVENARKHSTLHPRCGTSFLLVVLLTAILVFTAVFPMVPAVSDIGVLNQVFFVFVKLLLLFPIAGFAYEVIRFSARHPGNRLLSAAVWPGLMTQRITTREPDDAQLEDALASIRAVLLREESLRLNPGAPAVESVEEFESFDAYVKHAEAA
jgi:uncharacterized protein YqhQ